MFLNVDTLDLSLLLCNTGAIIEGPVKIKLICMKGLEKYSIIESALSLSLSLYLSAIISKLFKTRVPK